MSFEGVRLAEARDEEALFALLKEDHAENGFFPLSEPKVRGWCTDGCNRRNNVIVGVIEGPNGLEASVGLFPEEVSYSDNWIYVDRWVFVRPDCRKSTHAKRLIEFSKWVGDSMAIPVMLGVTAQEKTEAKVRLYRRQLPYIGGLFLHVPEGFVRG